MKLLCVWVLVGGLVLPRSDPLHALAQTQDWLHTEGNRIVDSAGNPVILTGISWFGLETESFAPHGLWARNWETLLDQIVDLGFNTLRLPFSSQLLDPSSRPNNINEELNPDLKGLSGFEVMDKIIAGAGQRGLKVILDRHRPDSHAQSDLWYTPEYSEERWIKDWVMLVGRYAGEDTVIGVDLHNEPHGRATWGSGDPATDWQLAAERAGNAILKVNPKLLIIVEGVDQYQGDWYWWGGNLMGAREHPVRLDVPNQLVYSTHVYGPDVYPQPWFSDPSFPDNLPEIWDRHWGYLSREGIAPVIVGEFGGRSVGEDKEGVWQRSLVTYLRQGNFSYIYWTLNPNSGDTGGILLDDWQSVDPAKQALLSGYQFPLIGIEQRGPAPATQLAPPAPPTPSVAVMTPMMTPATGALRARYRTANPSAQSRDSKPEFILVNTGSTPVPLDKVELRYWLGPEGDQPYEFHCDWAQLSCAAVTGEFGVSEAGSPFLRLRFGANAGVLSANQDTGEIKLRFNRANWSEFRQEEDYSFSPSTEYIDWERVTLYIDGQLVWGTEPGSNPAPIPTGTPVPQTAVPSLAQAATGTASPLPTAGSVSPLPTTPAPASPASTSGNLPGAGWAVLALVGVAVAYVLGIFTVRLGRKR